eukprot:28986-Eustigmatos_ZCMA.PRE.1
MDDTYNAGCRASTRLIQTRAPCRQISTYAGPLWSMVSARTCITYTIAAAAVRIDTAGLLH